MVAYDVWNSNQPVIILSATAHMPPAPLAAANAQPSSPLQYSILLVAYPDIYNNLHKLYSGVTDQFHLDMTPRLDLVDAVDADGDGRGELLFRETSDAGSGWGLTNKTVRSPGPSLVFLSGTNVTFTLIAVAADGSPQHDFFIDYNADRIPSVGEPKTTDFNRSNPLTQKLHLDRAGNFTYYCEYHFNTMHGNVLILGVPVPTGGGFNVALIPGIMLIALGGVLIFAAVYHVRAVRAAKRPK